MLGLSVLGHSQHLLKPQSLVAGESIKDTLEQLDRIGVTAYYFTQTGNLAMELL